MQLIQQAMSLHGQGRWAEAEVAYRSVLAAQPSQFDALHGLGVLKAQQGRLVEAQELLRAALKQRPGSTDILANLGAILHALNRYEEALTCIEQVLKKKPGDTEAMFGRATVLTDLKRFEEALSSYDRVLASASNHVPALIGRANLLARFLGQYEKALLDYDRALMLSPGELGAQLNRGITLAKLHRFDLALESFDRVLAAMPGNVDALGNRGNVLRALGRMEDAFACYDKVLAISPNNVEALFNRANALLALKRYEEALAGFDRVLVSKPDEDYVAGTHFNTKMLLCDWSNYDDTCTRLVSALREGRPIITPFALLGLPSSTGDHIKCAQIFSSRNFSTPAERLWQGERYAHDRIRIAYISGDFREHPVAHLLANVLEQHDRARFETIAISLGSNDQGEMRTRLQRGVDRFVDARNKSDAETARLMRELEIDIAIDLMGYTTDCRPAIMAHRAAPIQVNYLSYPGIVGTDYIDYIIADRFVIPEDQRVYFSEPIVYLPDSYLAYDTKRLISGQTPSRTEIGLPETGFVFFAYNNHYKLTPAFFNIWMRLLHAVEGSVLWLTGANTATMNNLRREAQARGADPSRLVFASFMKRSEDHLARYRVADLFLDTLPFNAQTTACDALWAGLPVLTCRGETFVGRVAESLLHAVGLPEMITGNLADYEALALKLAREPAMLAAVKAKLARNRDTCALFDTARFTRHIEAAYTTMWEIWQRSEAPRSFAVAPIASNGRESQG
jgi:protein O-GlcNAc transferase